MVAKLAACGSWVTITMVLPKSLFSLDRMVRTSCAEAASRLPVGSSARIRAGSVTMARAMATRCSWPPESWRGKWSRRSPRPTSLSAVAACSRRSAFFETGELQRQLDIFQRGQHRDQIELLEDEADVLVAPAGDLAVAERAQVLAEDADLAAGGPVHGGDQVQQRGFARARRPHERDELALVDLEVDVVERDDVELVADEFLGQIRVSMTVSLMRIPSARTLSPSFNPAAD